MLVVIKSKYITMYILKIIIFFLVIIFVGCAVGPDFKKPEVETPTNFRYGEVSPDSLLNLKWWELFEDPILDSLVQLALDNNKNVLIAASRVEEARATLGFTRADIFPKLSLDAGASRGDYILGIKLPSENNNFYISPVVNWELDFWGKFRRANEAAKAELIATNYAFNTVQISLITEVISTYFLLLDYKKRLEISTETLESRLESLDIIQKRFDKGIIPEIDLNQAQIQKEIAAGAIPFNERLIARTEHVLSILIGQLPAEIKHGNYLSIDSKIPQIPSGIPSQLLQRRPDILQAEYQLKAQNARIGVAQALRFPSISLTGLLGVASEDLSKLTTGNAGWSVSSNLFGPIFHFNKNVRRVEIEKERTEQARLNYENTVILAFREVEDALIEIETYKKQLTAVENKLSAARNAAFLSRERYDKGVASYLEVLETERTLFSVELELSELRQLYHNAYVKLYKALGGGWITREEQR
jgi:multidrug efflux system outer membrane protein